MTAFDLKVLWTVRMPTPAAEQQLLDHALAAGCEAVAIRTSNSRLVGAIPRFHAAGVKVFGWRWPAKQPVTGPANYYAIDQANFIAKTLIPVGLDGFYADIESDNDRKENDWDSATLAPLARDFCAIIRAAAGPSFELSITAGCAQPTGNPHIPWAEFALACDAAAPQTYWRRTNPTTGLPEDIHGGTPASSFGKAMKSWAGHFAGKAVEPIMGELAVITPAEISEFGRVASGHGVRRIHAYTEGNAVPTANLEAIAAL
jgi:hypothetical protein